MSEDAKGESDRHAGAASAVGLGPNLRLARSAAKITPDGLAQCLGVSAQQVQKYESGINRISATRLHRAALVLGVPVSFFFSEPEPGVVVAPLPPDDPDLMNFLTVAEGVELSRAFAGIRNPAVRRSVIELIRSLADGTDSEEESSIGLE